MVVYTRTKISIAELTATDLLQTATAEGQTEPMSAYRVKTPGHAEYAQVLHLPQYGRTGIAWGADATWADSTGDVDADVSMFLNDPEQWEQRN